MLEQHHISPSDSSVRSARLRSQIGAMLGCSHAPRSTERDSAADHDLVARTAAECGVEPPAPAAQQSLLLNALARAYDPHSRYLDPATLTRFRAQIRAPVDAPSALRAELASHAGYRIALLTLSSLYLRSQRSASADLRRELAVLREQGAELVVLDLRGNGGGAIKEAARVFGVFAGPGPVAQMRRRDRAAEALLAPATSAAWSGPMLVRVDAGTASVAELLAAAFQDTGRALLVGQRTYGKGTGQTLIPLGSPADAGEGAVDVTDRRFYRLDGRPLQCAGVVPDVVLAAPELPRECSSTAALKPDQLAISIQSARSATFKTHADAAPVRAALALIEKMATSAAAKGLPPPASLTP